MTRFLIHPSMRLSVHLSVFCPSTFIIALPTSIHHSLVHSPIHLSICLQGQVVSGNRVWLWERTGPADFVEIQVERVFWGHGSRFKWEHSKLCGLEQDAHTLWTLSPMVCLVQTLSIEGRLVWVHGSFPWLACRCSQ